MADRSFITENTEFQQLLEQGFSEHEAGRLVYMKEHVSEQLEYREIIEQNRRLSFIRWLLENDRISR